MMKFVFGSVLTGLLLGSCAGTPLAETPRNETASEESASEEVAAETQAAEDSESSGVIAVHAIQEKPLYYSFDVTVASADTGCDRYANWWEVITEDGELLYRRILAHSHVDEQPFSRSGGPVELTENEVVIVRSHMHPTGYQPQAMKGSFSEGFEPTTIPTDFAIELTEVAPLPSGCAF